MTSAGAKYKLLNSNHNVALQRVLVKQRVTRARQAAMHAEETQREEASRERGYYISSQTWDWGPIWDPLRKSVLILANKLRTLKKKKICFNMNISP